jgi:predicted GNAT family N-acyltransferase
MEIKQTRDTMSDIYIQALKIRHEVFVKEQGVPLNLEIDENEAYTIHFVMYTDDMTPAATLRLLPSEDHKSFLLQRMAVMPDFRGQGFANTLIADAVQFVKAQGGTQIVLHAQIQAVGLYEKNGFKKVGDVFEEAGIQHYEMIRDL